MRSFNWQIWLALIVSVFAFLSYPLVFSAWPATRDFPWVNLLLFVIAAVLLYTGVRRAFGRGRGWISRTVASFLVLFTIGAFALFILMAFVASRWLPAAGGAPRVGDKAPEFALLDTNSRAVSLSQLLTQPIPSSNTPPRAVVLIFYRGYW